jgi:hypothetical protein
MGKGNKAGPPGSAPAPLRIPVIRDFNSEKLWHNVLAQCYTVDIPRGFSKGADVFSRKCRERAPRPRRNQVGPWMLTYGDTLRTELKARRREELFYLH